MNKNDLLEEALNRIDPKFAEDTARKMNRRNRKSAKSPAWQPGLLIAAAALLLALVGGGIFAITRMGGRPGNEPTKPTEFADQNDPTNPSQYNPTSPSQHDPTNPVSPDEPSSDAPRVDFMSEMTFSTDRKSADYLSSFLPFGDRVALYSSLWLPSDTDEAATKANEEILRSHLGELYYTGLMKWYMVDDSVNLKNLIREEADGRLSLWQFSCFQTWGGDMLQEEFPGKIIGDYEYKTLLATFYHVTSAEDIERVEILPTTGVRSTGNGTPAGGVQPILIEDPHDIQSIYDILRKMVCSGTGSMVDNAADVNSENFFNAVNAHPALRSSLERDIRIVLKDGSSIQGLKYSAFQCAFYENGGIAYGGLGEEDIVAMNKFADIRPAIPLTP